MIHGRNVNLRVLERKDLELLRRWKNSPAVNAFYADKPQLSELEQEQWFETVSLSQSCRYFVIEHKGEPVGVCNISAINHLHGTGSFGIYFSPDEQGRGVLPLEASRLLFEYCFSVLNLRKICCDVLAANEQTLKFVDALGFQEEGRQKQQVFHQGEYVDLVLLGLFRH